MRAAAQLDAEPPAVAHVEDRTVPGPGGPIPVRLYTPDVARPCPVLVFFHGGGWVLGDLETHDVPCRELANAAGCMVIAVDYRLAPEHKFPAASEDAFAATKWVAENAESISVDPKRIAVGGDSAGGNLAAAVALMAKDRGGPALAYQLLVYPITNHAFGSDSYVENADGYGLSRDGMKWFWEQFLASAADGAHPYASPLLAPELRGLPPALVITAEYDPLRDEGEAYAERLRQAGVTVKCSRYDGMIHGFFRSPVLDPARTGIREAAAALRAAFA